MNMSRERWPQWAETLKRYQVHRLAAWLIEAGGPLNLLGAQALYFGRSLFVPEQMDALAQTLENDDEARAFAAYLQEGIP